MNLINRPYLAQLLEVLDTPDIKVITGVRRAGKSTLMRQLAEHIALHMPQANVIHINYNSIETQNLRQDVALHQYIQEHYQANCPNYLLIDEVQMCTGFETVLNSLHDSQKYFIVVTGSNAFLEHSDLSTLFVGRTFSLPVFPFSLSEYCLYYPDLYIEDAFDRYVRDGGFAGSYVYANPALRCNYVSEVFQNLITRDIVTSHRVQDEAVLGKLIDFLSDNIGNITSAHKITQILAHENLPIHHNTLATYLDYLCRAFAFYRVRRFDIKGKEYLRSQDKYYLVDPAFRQARLGHHLDDRGRVEENLVAIELLRRGWEVYTGALPSGEIDFVAKKFDQQMYIQVCHQLTNPETIQREVKNLLNIKDAHPKIILTHYRAGLGTQDGVIVADIARWLQDPHYLDNYC